MDLCKSLFTNWRVTATATSRFSLLHSIRPAGRIFCSSEHGKLCFGAPGINSVPQNNLPFAGGRKTLSEVEFLYGLKMD